MVVFPNAKINLGLNVLSKRPDGFHNIESVFYPIDWCDVLEILENPNWKKNEDKITLRSSGIPIAGNSSDNLITKVYNSLSHVVSLPPIEVHLHKVIPMGAGLGGGSSDAAFFLRLINEKFELNLSTDLQINLLSHLGSDCPFFYWNKPSFAKERGNILTPFDLSLKGLKIFVVYPGIHSNTAEAYHSIKPHFPEIGIDSILKMPIHDWKNLLINDFEHGLFLKYPDLLEWKNRLYESGALYASMTGSGSTIFGIFENDTPDFSIKENEIFWRGTLS